MDSMVFLLQIILQKYMSHSYCLSIISENNVYLPTNTTSVRFGTIDLDNILATLDMGCSDFVIQVDDPIHFAIVLEKVLFLSNTRRGDRKFIFVPKRLDDSDELLNVLQTGIFTYIPNVILIVPTNKKVEADENCEDYDIVTHKFVGPYEEDIKIPIVLDRWNSCRKVFERNENLFPHDIANMYGRTVKVACFMYPPFVILNLDKQVSRNGRDGLDMRVVDELCSWINCTIEVVDVGAGQWGTVYPNATGTGVLGAVAMGKADFGITSLGYWDKPYPMMDFSAYTFLISVTNLVPKPRLLSRWELPIIAFSFPMWMVTIFSMVYSWLALVLAQHGSTNNAWLNIWRIMMAQPCKLESSWRSQFVLLGPVVTGLIINAAYSAGLSSLFTIPNYEKSIDTVEDLLESGLEWGAPDIAWVYSISSAKDERHMRIVDKFRLLTPSQLKARGENQTIALSIELLPAGCLAIGGGEAITTDILNNYQLLTEDLFFGVSTVAARKNSPYVAKLNDRILRLIEAGLLLAWDSQISLKYQDVKVKMAIKYSRNAEPPTTAPLNLVAIGGIFMILVAGIIVSFIVFLVEMAQGRQKHKKETM
ncbi:uncharacterized protein LOC119691976 [Plutella xylostella]|uniref:uncharacterized protein LOC119691976 n=1 Tax=Plutella xylostella TaxID=51655 RepID=UPI0020329BB5|nr:uncharacterized protein LOC119691976 [Plutella xylostella]